MSDAVELQRVFPQEVHDSLAELRRISKVATGRDYPGLRQATSDELALAEALRQPYHCKGHSTRTGLPCTKPHVRGAAVCIRHGAGSKVAKRKAQQRLLHMIDPLLTSQFAISQLTDERALSTAQKAGADLLDRAGVGALVQAKVRASRHQQSNGAQVVVNIGFLG